MNISFRNKLLVKLFGAITISFLIASVALNSIIPIFFSDYYLSGELTPTMWNILTFFIFTFVISIFIISLILLTRKKLIYLNNITESVQEIANGNLGLEIELKGRDELTQLAKNINYMSKKLENTFEHERQLEFAKNELITNVSHDLRTPLTSIIGYADLLRNGQYDSKEKLQEYHETIFNKSQRLKHLMDELFEYTRLSSPDIKLNLSEVELVGIFEQIVGEYTPIFDKEQLCIQKTITVENIPVVVDIEKIVRVYENLFINAIKYSLKPSIVKMSFETKENKAVFTISNRVEQPPLADLSKLFERFFREDKARGDNRGTGLGLAICKRIVELHNGAIDVEYQEGWITFTVEYPLYS
ncbi:sensor histidine kinase [Anaerobacillus isosaccharinicus]|uniref:histidine kinase n=1 Tax=Anaerobacillus isosaccharinicus TaxID=1532552 RepID=A0A1S2L2T0_9BACI|nr:HAMP domain-containing sensor histidine kinase [Anaerobacillus isosaccharinicus]MBA5586435.1 HAMP domain-containing histidine kinase [Anaerobacillus isosaccharinicus]QOY35322.1 HAMP domain-containing histidine kinase [Anaerobacillus isosaccharinicus]